MHRRLKKGEGRFKEQKTRSWHEKTLGEIIETIAAEHGYEPRVFEELGSEVIPHIDQTTESDMNFLTRLAQDRNAIFKPAGGTIVFTKRGQSTTARGEIREPVLIKDKDLTSWRATIPGRVKYGSVAAYWMDLSKGERIEVVAGEGGPVKRLRGNCANKEAAERAAMAELERITQGGAEISLSLPGDMRLMAETDIAIKSLMHEGGMREPFAGIWSIKKAVHRLSSSGFTTSIDCEYPAGKA